MRPVTAAWAWIAFIARGTVIITSYDGDRLRWTIINAQAARHNNNNNNNTNIIIIRAHTYIRYTCARRYNMFTSTYTHTHTHTYTYTYTYMYTRTQQPPETSRAHSTHGYVWFIPRVGCRLPVSARALLRVCDVVHYLCAYTCVCVCTYTAAGLVCVCVCVRTANCDHSVIRKNRRLFVTRRFPCHRRCIFVFLTNYRKRPVFLLRKPAGDATDVLPRVFCRNKYLKNDSPKQISENPFCETTRDYRAFGFDSAIYYSSA